MSSPTQLLLCDCVAIVLVAIRVQLCDSRRFRAHTSTALWQVLVFTQIVEVHNFVTPTVLVFTQIVEVHSFVTPTVLVFTQIVEVHSFVTPTVLVFTQIVEVHSFVTPTVLDFSQMQFCESTRLSTQVQLCDTNTNDSPRFQWHEHSFVTVLICLGTEFCGTYKVHKCSFETVLVLHTSTGSFATVLVCKRIQFYPTLETMSGSFVGLLHKNRVLWQQCPTLRPSFYYIRSY